MYEPVPGNIEIPVLYFITKIIEQILESRNRSMVWFFIRLILQIIGEPEKIIPGGLHSHGFKIRQAKKFDGIIYKAALHIFVKNAIDIYLTVPSFKFSRVYEVRKGVTHFDRNKLGLVVVTGVKAYLHLAVVRLFEKIYYPPVSNPVK